MVDRYRSYRPAAGRADSGRLHELRVHKHKSIDEHTLKYSPVTTNPATISLSSSSGTTPAGSNANGAATSITVGNLTPGQSAVVSYGNLPAGVTVGYTSITGGVSAGTTTTFTQDATVGIAFQTSSTTPAAVTQIPITLTMTGQQPTTEYYTLTVTSSTTPGSLSVTPQIVNVYAGTQTGEIAIAVNLGTGDSTATVNMSIPVGVTTTIYPATCVTAISTNSFTVNGSCTVNIAFVASLAAVPGTYDPLFVLLVPGQPEYIGETQLTILPAI